MRTQLDFEAQFGSEADCLQYLRQMRWPHGFPCPNCSRRSAWDLQSRPLMECRSLRAPGVVDGGDDLSQDAHSASHLVSDHRPDERLEGWLLAPGFPAVWASV